MSLHANFTDENVAMIDNDGDPRIEVTFKAAAQNLTRRAKVEIALAACAAYSAEVQRLTHGGLVPSHVYNNDGSIGTEAEVRPAGPMM